MKKYILVVLGCTSLCLSFADYCWVNKQWDKYCTYDNGCYEYWNKNGTHFDSCDPKNNTDASKDRAEREEYNNYLYEQGLEQDYQDKTTSSDYRPTVAGGNKVKFIDTINSFDGIFSWFWVLLLCGIPVFGVIYSLHEHWNSNKLKQFDSDSWISTVKNTHPPLKHHIIHVGEVTSWYSSLEANSRKTLAHFYDSLWGVKSKKDIKKKIDEYYEKNLSHIYSSEDKVYKDLYSLKDYL